jgi:hypothetical protein
LYKVYSYIFGVKILRMRLPLLFFLCFVQFTFAQDFNSTISTFLNREAEKYDFSFEDVDEFIMTDYSYSKSMDLNMVYIQQHYQGIPIHNAIGSFAIKDNAVNNFDHSFMPNLNTEINLTSPVLSAETALNSALDHLELGEASTIQLVDVINLKSYIFSLESSSEIIPVKLMYVQDDKRNLRLSWDLSILTPDENHWWSVSIDAITGEMIRKNDWMLSCNFETATKSQSQKSHTHPNENKTSSLSIDGSQYRAYPLGIESPNHGNRALLSQPADLGASPFGWHDVDGVVGPEFTITRGNNVLASEDRDANNVFGYSPDGGTNLVFDFTYDPNLPPEFSEDAAITNLFVWNNYTHDVWFNYGFDEASGNFQQTNYSGSGTGGDYVLADAQDGGGLNNANFGTPPDGFNPRMQMFLWSPPGPPSNPLIVNAPSDISGGYQGVEAVFGPGLTPTPITADLALVEDNNSSPSSSDIHDACDPFTNASALNGKIVVINRGDCTFVQKIESAQSAGAIAVIMVNNVFGNPISMGGDNPNITIPSIMISQSNGSPLITKLQNGETINATLVNNGPYEIDGDFDNGIIAHEYGHGISNRLTGGPSQANCLFNDEQMGEGWSDWLGLMMTLQPGDFAEQARGIGTFAVSQPVTGQGIRPAPYSTNLNVNPATYGISNNAGISIPHGVGFVWATTLWDLTWELIDQYGFDPDIANGSGGNNLAMQLVIDGMKLQNCLPGFIDGRDAILQADMLANNGANQCFIWKVFANRGLGFSADQGSASDRFDQVEAFDLPGDITLPCQVLSNETFDENSLKIYPNPARDFITIETNGVVIGNANVKIYDLNGRLLLNKPLDLSQNQQIDVSNLNRGLYVLKIVNTNFNLSKKLIIN